MKTDNTPMTDEQIIEKHDPSVRRRARTELEIVHRVIKDLSNAGYLLAVDDGEETTKGFGQHLVSAIFEVDQAHLTTSKKDRKDSFVFFVLGNSGHDVISDYGVSLEDVIGPINDWVDAQVDSGKF